MKRLLLILLPLFLCGAASFDGSSQGASTTANISDVGTNRLTVAYWVNHSVTNIAVMLELSANANSGTQALPRFGIYRGDSDSGSEDFNLKAAGNRVEYVTGNVAGSWMHRTVVFDISTSGGDVIVYTNGIVAGTTLRVNTLGASGVGFTTAQRFFVGARNNTTTRMTGFLQDVAIFAGEVSAAEAYSLGAQRMSPLKVRSAKLLHYWPFSAGENPNNSPDLVGGIPVNSGTKSITTEQAPTIRK